MSVLSTFAVLAVTMALIGVGHLLARHRVLTTARNHTLAALLTDAAFPLLCLSRIGAMSGPLLRARVAHQAQRAHLLRFEQGACLSKRRG